MAKEKKYFMAGTDEEVLLGDVISQTLVKDLKDGRKISREVEFKLTEETLPYALEMNIIEEEVEEEENNEKFFDFADDDCPFAERIEEIIENQETLEKRVEVLEAAIESNRKLYKELRKRVDDVDSKLKPASSKKK
jgi:hypothetical protein